MSKTNYHLGYYWSSIADDVVSQVNLLVATGANTVFVPGHFLERIPFTQLNDHGIRVIADWGCFIGDELRQRYPDSVPVSASGQLFERDDWYVPICPNHPGVRRQHLEGIARLLEQHGAHLSGLWLDFIRYPVRWEGSQPTLGDYCFCRHCLNLFLGESREQYTLEETHTLAQAILAERRAEWVAWKCGRVLDFTHAVRRLIDASGQPLRLGIFCLPWRTSDFDGAIRTVAGQDLGRLAEIVDTFSPMVYHRLCGQNVAWIGEMIADAQVAVGRKTLPIVQAMDRPGVLGPQELADTLTLCLAVESEGAMIFTLDDVEKSAEKAAAVTQVFAGAN